MKALVEIQYLPPLEYFAMLMLHPETVLERHENYIKQSYRNRCYINTANGVLKLVVPVSIKGTKARINEVYVDNKSKWQNLHWRAIQSGYGKAPFFEHYEAGLRHILFQGHELLYDLDFALLSFCLQSIQLKISLSASNSYEKVPNDDIIDVRSVITPKIPPEKRSFYLPVPYQQVFGNKFVSNLSIIDLLFCEGPNAMQILRSSTRGYLNK